MTTGADDAKTAAHTAARWGQETKAVPSVSLTAALAALKYLPSLLSVLLSFLLASSHKHYYQRKRIKNQS